MGKTKDANHQELMEVINSFDFGGELEEVGIFGNGHINETYCAVFSTEAGQKRYILQKMNKQIFKDPVGLMAVSYTHLGASGLIQDWYITIPMIKGTLKTEMWIRDRSGT